MRNFVADAREYIVKRRTGDEDLARRARSWVYKKQWEEGLGAKFDVNKVLRSVKEKARYDLAISMGASVKQARRLRTIKSPEIWSDILGRKIEPRIIPKAQRVAKKPTSKKISKVSKTRLKKYRDRYNYLRRLGFSSKEATKYRSDKAYKKITAKERLKKERERLNIKDINLREIKWAKWIKNKSMPKAITDYVALVNKLKNLPATSGYGFGIVWYWYTRGKTLKYWMNKLKPDPTDHDAYLQPNTKTLAN